MIRNTLLLVCFLAPLLVSGTSENKTEPVVRFTVKGFNYEFARRTVDRLDTYLNRTVLVSRQTQLAFELGMLQEDQTDQVRAMLFTQLESNPTIGGVSVLFTQSALGYLRRHGVVTFFIGRNGACPGDNTTRLPPSVDPLILRCMTDMSIDTKGRPVDTLRQVTIVLGAEIRAPLEGTWSNINPLQGMDTGLMYTAKLTNKAGDTIGILSSILFASNIENFLSTNFGANTTENTLDNLGRVVFITNEEDQLLAASIPNLSSVVNDQGLAVSIPVAECSNKLIRDAGIIIGLVPDSYHNDKTLVIARGLYIQQPAIFRSGLQLHIISARPANPILDYPGDFSVALKILIALSSFILAGIIALGAAIVRFRRRVRLWRYAQPWCLIGILISNALMLVYACVLLTAPSTHKCKALLWLRTFVLTAMSACLLVKINLMVLAASTHDSALNKPAKKMIAALAVVFIVQLILVAVQNHIVTSSDEELIETAYGEMKNNLATRKSCKFYNNGLEATTHAIILLVSAVTVVRAGITRNVSTMCEESRGLFVAAVEATIICVAVISIRWTSRPENSTQSVLWLEAGLMLWYVFSMMVFVFVPRLHRQLTTGDMTVTEMRQMIKSKNVLQQKQGMSSTFTTSHQNERKSERVDHSSPESL